MAEAAGYYDEFGFYSPQPTDRATRRQPGEDHPTGPEVGTRVPAIELTDQSGSLVNVQSTLGAAGGVVMFHRSAYW